LKRTTRECYAGNELMDNGNKTIVNCKWPLNNATTAEPPKHDIYIKGWRDMIAKASGLKFLPNSLGRVTSVLACKELALKGKFNTYALHNYGSCYGGNL
jgi:hypothetical protein